MIELADVTEEEFRTYYHSLSEDEQEEMRDFARGARRFVEILENMGEIEASA